MPILLLTRFSESAFTASYKSKLRRYLILFHCKNAAKIALDLPSGCECDSGAAAKSAFNADVTISFIAVKPCHVLYPAQDNCGKLVRVGIGLNSEHMANVKCDVELIDSAFVERCLPKNEKKQS